MLPLLVYVPEPSNCSVALLFTPICPPATLLTMPPSLLVPVIAMMLPVELFVSVPPWIVPLDRFRVDPADKVTAPPFTIAAPLTVPVVLAPSRMVPLVLVKVLPDSVSTPERSDGNTSELGSPGEFVCRVLL